LLLSCLAVPASLVISYSVSLAGKSTAAKPTVIASATPTATPSVKPTAKPVAKPTVNPTAKPTVIPTAKPTAKPVAKPTVIPTAKPTVIPTAKPTAKPVAKPTAKPVAKPTVIPTAKPTVNPTAKPTVNPTAKPTVIPTAKPTAKPVAKPAVKLPAKPAVTPVAKPKPVVITSYQPLKFQTCFGIRTEVMNTLKLGAIITKSAPFEDKINKIKGEACQVDLNSTGVNFKSMTEITTPISEVLTKQGWKQDKKYSADGAEGKIMAFRKGNDLVLTEVKSKLSEYVKCPKTAPIATCYEKAKPEQITYEIVVKGVNGK
jgi:PT repeat